MLFDFGENPTKAKANQEARKTYFLAQFDEESIPDIGDVKTTKCFIPEHRSRSGAYIGYDDPYELGYSKEAISIVNKPPRWSKSKCRYVYNFGGRVRELSSKNTQLVVDNYLNKVTKEGEPNSPEDKKALLKEHVVFQVGKYDKATFNLDFQCPLSIFQAFALGVAIQDS